MQYLFIDALTHQLSFYADSEIGNWQKAYMKNKYNFFGVQQPLRIKIQKELFASHVITTTNELVSVVMELWNHEKRECLYAATDLLLHYKNLWTEEILDLFKYCIVTHSWWDTVDDLASNCVGHLCVMYPKLTNIMDQWIINDDMWLRRTALIFQLRYKTKTDTKRLFSYCEKTMHEKEFFIRKAIGWALREYSKTNAQEVAHFVMQHSTTLSPLSKREAYRIINKTF